MAEISVSRKAATEQRRSAILQAARAVFARQGYSDTVVDDIATQAGIGKGTIYLYFPSKEQIYLAALLEEARQLDADSRAAMSAAGSWRDKLAAYLQVRLRYFESHRDFLRIYMMEFRGMCMQGKPFSAENSCIWPMPVKRNWHKSWPPPPPAARSARSILNWPPSRWPTSPAVSWNGGFATGAAKLDRKTRPLPSIFS